MRVIRGLTEGVSPQYAFLEIRMSKDKVRLKFEVDFFDLDNLTENQR